MANIAPYGIYKAFDAAGASLAFGKLYTYVAGTSTPLATYTTAAGDIANTNPVQLDANGEANVWLGDGGYKFVLTDADDAIQFTTDNIGGSGSTAFGATVNDISTNTTITTVYANSINNVTGSTTLTLLPASDAGEGFYFNVNVVSGTTIIDPDAGELINGSATLTMASGTSALIYCDGTQWRTLFYYSGTAAAYNIGTSGATIPLNNGNNTSSGNQTHTGVETFSNAVNFAKGADIASATTTDIGAATGNYINVTGTTTITGLGTIQAGTQRIVNFTGILTLTYNATSLILPTSANIITAVGDSAEFVSLGSGNWRCVNYLRANGTPLNNSPVYIGSAYGTISGGVLTVQRQNLGTLARSSSGVFTWAFTSAEANANYHVSLTTTRTNSTAVSDICIQDSSKTGSGFTFQTGATGGAFPNDPDAVSLMIWRIP